MKTIVLIFLSIFSLHASSFAQSSAEDRKAILQVLEVQTQAWNKGDLEAFMQGYWKSDSLAFIGSKGVTYGWQNTLNNYQKGYPDQASRGTLQFNILRVELLGKDTAFVIGKFHLTRPEKGDANGHFTLLWKKVKGKWVITTDHSS